MQMLCLPAPVAGDVVRRPEKRLEEGTQYVGVMSLNMPKISHLLDMPITTKTYIS